MAYRANACTADNWVLNAAKAGAVASEELKRTKEARTSAAHGIGAHREDAIYKAGRGKLYGPVRVKNTSPTFVRKYFEDSLKRPILTNFMKLIENPKETLGSDSHIPWILLFNDWIRGRRFVF